MGARCAVHGGDDCLICERGTIFSVRQYRVLVNVNGTITQHLEDAWSAADAVDQVRLRYESCGAPNWAIMSVTPAPKDDDRVSAHYTEATMAVEVRLVQRIYKQFRNAVDHGSLHPTEDLSFSLEDLWTRVPERWRYRP